MNLAQPLEFLLDTKGTKENSLAYADFLNRRLLDLAFVGISLRPKMDEDGGRSICLVVEGVEGKDDRVISIEPTGKEPMEFDYKPREICGGIPRLESISQEVGGVVVCKLTAMEDGRELVFTYKIYRSESNHELVHWTKKDCRLYGADRYFSEFFKEGFEHPARASQ